MTLSAASWLGSFPWLIGAALCFALAAATRLRRAEAAALAGLTAATFLGRLALAPALFFHQNGQGPHQIERALHGVFREHGPGVVELFRGAAALRPRDPEGAAFLVQSALAAPGPACAWLIARRADAPRPLAAALALAVALDPMLARLARSESYFGAGASLLLLAAAALSLRASRAPPRSAPFALAALAAGALVAQAARLHPLLWPAAALTPLVLLAGAGSLRRRARAAVAAAAVIAAVALPVAGPSMWDALHSDLAARLSPRVTSLDTRPPPEPWAPLGLLAVAAALSRRPWGAAQRALLAAPVGVAVYAANFPASSRLVPWVEGAYLRVYAAAFVVVVAASLRDLARTRAQSWAVAALGAAALLVPVALRHARDRVVPTDAREADLARSWRTLVPPGATLLWLAQADQGTLRLPIYPDADADLREARPLDVPRLARLPDAPRAHATWYYRSSLCSTAAGAAACDDVERRLPLRLVRAWSLRAVESYSLPFVRPTVRVALYRVEPPPAR